MSDDDKLRPLVLRLAGAMNLPEEQCAKNEPTETILLACIHRYSEAMYLIRQGVEMLK